MRNKAWLRLALGVVAVGLFVDCRGRLARAAPREPGTRTQAADPVVERVYDSGYVGEWVYFGWADRETQGRGPEKLKMAKYGGWMINDSKHKGPSGGVVFRFKAPASWGDFLEVKLDSEVASLPAVRIGPQHRKDLPDGWSEVFVGAAEVNPDFAPVQQVRLRAFREIPPPGLTEFDGVALTAIDPKALAAAEAKPGVPATFTVDCGAPTKPISPFVYGIAMAGRDESDAAEYWKLNPTARRWGGNPASRYNWELGNARNNAVDWYFENISMGSVTWKTFLTVNLKHKVRSALTVPTIGWVAKDTRSAGFPVSEYGPQAEVDTDKGAGNGVGKDGKPLPSGPPTRTSVPAPPEFIGRWVQAVNQLDRELGSRTVHMYILDNEPALWHDTHRDVHPAPLTYDELLDKTVKYAQAIRKADRDAMIAGPAEWGWPAYFYSAEDGVKGFSLAPDRRAHGNVPLLDWYLKRLKEHEEKTGERLLDVLDLHFYPQGQGIGVDESGAVDRDTNARRIRSTRGLWDPSYSDESWIKEPVRLIPRMKEWVDTNYPGLKLSIGEYSFGAEKHISGGLALAEALGRFGQQGLYSAYYWTYPAEGTPAYWGFRAFRNYDGKGAAFEENSMPTQAPPEASAFAARSADGRRATVVLLNFSPAQGLEASVTFKGCPAPESQRFFTYAGGPAGFAEKKVAVGSAYSVRPASISVIEVTWPSR